VKKTNLANPKREEAWNQCWPITAFFFHNWLSGFFFGTTHGININYLKKKKLISYQFHHQNNTPNYQFT
jgi:hypothetical protein